MGAAGGCAAAATLRAAQLPPGVEKAPPPGPALPHHNALRGPRAAPRASDDVASTLAVPGNPDGVSCATADLSAGQVGQLYALDALRAGFL